MLSVEEARTRMLAQFAPLEAVERPIVEALGQTLAEDVRAPFDLPTWPNSAMDGYAVRREDVRDASPTSPRVLRVIGQVAAGQEPRQRVTPGAAIRIMTGAPIPTGATAIVPFEDTDESTRQARGDSLEAIGVLRPVEAGANIRPAGEDVHAGDVALPKGQAIRPWEIAVLASLGVAHVKVVRRPVVAILATGDELLSPGEPRSAAKTYDSNSYALAAAVARDGGIPRRLGIARDNMQELHTKLGEGLDSDLLLTSAGVSRGDYDMVKEALRERGEVSFWTVRMRPAKPLAFGLLDGPGGRRVLHIGLPGNPVSTMVAYEQFVRPAIRLMLGKAAQGRPRVRAVLEGAIQNVDGRRVYARVRVVRRDGAYRATPTGPQGSHIITSMAKANGLAICPEDVPLMEVGQVVDVEMLDWNEEVEL
ncbi:MAG: molybdopterin molybdotransferase MoeA [Chloroflexota bacterium]|nr:molybdopterin molybdotransferase MoeA [Chloroflexota bacterium]